MKYEIKTAREEENAATQRVRDGRRRSSLSSFGGMMRKMIIDRIATPD